MRTRSSLLILCCAMLGLSPVVASERPPAAFGPEVYHERRLALLDSLGEGTAVLYSRGEYTETGYMADGHFWYLTGNDEPGAILLLSPQSRYREVLLLSPRDIEAERWTGERPALTDSLQVAWQFDLVARTGWLDGRIVALMKMQPILHLISSLVSPGAEMPPDLDLYGKVTARIPGVDIRNSSHFIERMRMVKSDDEIAAIEEAIRITHEGLTAVAAAMQPGMMEYQLDGVLEETFKRQGSQHMAFAPIVGAGKETTVLHYERRDQPLQSGQLLLLDVGARWNRYCADISRTFPVGGKFTTRQAEIYDIVLRAQQAAIDAIRPGITVDSVHQIARNIIRQAGYADAFIHGTSHHLGLDVHDVADYSLPLAPGMVITVEPGIYLPEEELGVRIEDDVLVTRTGSRVLSGFIPRGRSEVEAWVAAALTTPR